MSSTKKLARTAGLLYLLLLPAPFALIYVPSVLYVPGNATATAANITSSESLFRAGIAVGLAVDVVLILLVLALYRLFKEVNRAHALLMVVLVVVSVAASLLNNLTQIAVLIVLSGADFLAEFSKPQLDALAMIFVRLHGNGIQVISLYWGLWLLPLGALVWKSRFIPRFLGVLLIINGFAYVVSTFTFLLFPDYVSLVSRLTLVPKVAGELPFMLWLLIKGAKTQSTETPAPFASTITASIICLPLTWVAMLAAVSLSAQTPLIEQGRAALNRGDSDAAIAILQKSVVQSPKIAEAHFYLASAYGSKAQKGGMFGVAE